MADQEEDIHTTEETVQDSTETSESETVAIEAVDPIIELQKQIEAEKNQYLRLYAEFENFRRRNAKERIELIGTASAEVIKDILTVLDDFERAIESNKTMDDINAVKQGFELLSQKLFKILASKGLAPIESKGEAFDAEIHEAIAQIPVKKDAEKGKILEIVERGYKLNDKMIRHPKVVVGS